MDPLSHRSGLEPPNRRPPPAPRGEPSCQNAVCLALRHELEQAHSNNERIRLELAQERERNAALSNGEELASLQLELSNLRRTLSKRAAAEDKLRDKVFTAELQRDAALVKFHSEGQKLLRRVEELEAQQKRQLAENMGTGRVSKRALMANLFGLSTSASPAIPVHGLVAEQSRGEVNLPGDQDIGCAGLPPLMQQALDQYEGLREGAAAEVTLQDVLRVQVEKMRLENDELRSDYEALFHERKLLQSLSLESGAGNGITMPDTQQLAVELASANDALAALEQVHNYITTELHKHVLLEQRFPAADLTVLCLEQRHRAEVELRSRAEARLHAFEAKCSELTRQLLALDKNVGDVAPRGGDRTSMIQACVVPSPTTNPFGESGTTTHNEGDKGAEMPAEAPTSLTRQDPGSVDDEIEANQTHAAMQMPPSMEVQVSSSLEALPATPASVSSNPFGVDALGEDSSGVEKLLFMSYCVYAHHGDHNLSLSLSLSLSLCVCVCVCV